MKLYDYSCYHSSVYKPESVMFIKWMIICEKRERERSSMVIDWIQFRKKNKTALKNKMYNNCKIDL